MSVPAGSRVPASVLTTVLTELLYGLSFMIKVHLKTLKTSGFISCYLYLKHLLGMFVI